ncbi:hypothetical protein Tc00.1047053504933.30 [Trypanosoma cruzi]|uniref:Uncharacterized protein n=1 Tax=Trypanosoma cruzi (strain CL Brener) TaxID=353153 RepID=Q4CRE8_TRYCC|nr:uncharacterized protein Tc00.1047053504933.30 [Trypanosoma cruzi]EAN82852.1 hypothetical protein Tc00.1047053504933.30 [Trypanosoma cruzi]|eukprot:XP_804703.1 hypothetical protein Tc00.1047053504933.30 [Trypanosoma cruzi strain CL Brener]
MGSVFSKKSEEPPKAQTGKAKRASLPSPAAPAATAKVPADDAHATGFSAAFEERIRRFYAHYSPDKVDTVPVILRHWTGTEEELIQTLVRRYGPELNDAAKTPAPPLTENATDDAKVWESRFARQLLAYRPERLSRLRRVLERAKGKEEATLMSFIKQMGPEPQGPLPDPLHDTTRISTNEASRKTVQEEVDPQPAVVTKAEQPAEVMETPSTIKDMTAEKVDSVEEKNVVPVHSLKRRMSSFLGVRVPEKLPALEEYLRRYAEEGEKLFDSLRENYGADPTEEETKEYFVRRLEGLYTCYKPESVASAASEVAAHYGTEEEYLETRSKELNADPKMMFTMTIGPTEETRAQLFEYGDKGTQEPAQCDKNNDEEPKTNVHRVEAEALPDVENCLPEKQSNDFQDVPLCDEPILSTTDPLVADDEPPTENTPKLLQKTKSDTEEDFKQMTETLSHTVEEQQRQLTALQAEIDRLGSFMEDFQIFSPKKFSFSPAPVKKQQLDCTSMPSPSSSPQISYKLRRTTEASVANTKSSSFDCHACRHGSVEDLLPPPPPPRCRPPRNASSATRQLAVKVPSLFVLRTPSPSREVRTLAEMRLEYERERENICSAEKRLLACGVVL